MAKRLMGIQQVRSIHLPFYLDLKPLTSTAYEAGVDVRFFENRLGLDLTYYIRNTSDDIVTAQISSVPDIIMY